jgi:hypothetical protein
MAASILKCTLDNKRMEDKAIRVIAEQLNRHPAIQGILTSIVTAKDFQACFKCDNGSKDGLQWRPYSWKQGTFLSGDGMLWMSC